jgi:S1-C subfamily serine protease
MVRAYRASRGAAAAILVLLVAAPAVAQDAASTASYPQDSAKAVRKVVRARRPAVRHAINVPLPQRRPAPLEPKREPDKLAALPLPPERAGEPKPKSEPAAAPVPVPTPAPKVASAPAQEPARKEEPVAPPINEGGSNDWRVVTDPATGIVIGIPRRLLTGMHEAAHGTRWSAAHGEIQLETFRLSEPGLTLAAFSERMKREPANRKIEFNTLKDDSFVLGGTQGLRDFYIRAAVKNGEIRGFSVIYDVAMETIMEPLRTTMSNAFMPFPDRPAAFALPAKAVEYGSGVVISADGHIVTSARLAESCSVVSVAGLGPAERIAASDGIALLRVYGARKLAPAALSNSGAAGPLTLLGVPDPQEQQGGSATRELSAKVSGAALDLAKPVPLAGFSGAAALDREGRLAGLVDLSSVAVASTGTPPLRMIEASAIRTFLGREGVEPYDGSGNARAAVVRVICVRK